MIANVVRPRALLFALALTGVALGAARAEFAETPFAPAPGSRWTIEDAQESVQKTPEGGMRTQVIRQSNEVTFEEKLADGWRVSFLIKQVEVSGDAPAVALLGPALGTMKGIRFEGVLDARGKPVEIRDLEKSRARMSELVEETAKAFADKPQLASAMRSMMTSLIVLDGKQAAETYLEPLNVLSAAHATGLKPGEERSETMLKPNPLGGDAIKSVSVTRIAQPDPASGLTIVTRTEAFDAASVKQAALTVARRLLGDLGGAAKVSQSDVERVVAMLDVSLDGLSVYDVREGMARSAKITSATRMSAMGKEFGQQDKRSLTVTPAP